MGLLSMFDPQKKKGMSPNDWSFVPPEMMGQMGQNMPMQPPIGQQMPMGDMAEQFMMDKFNRSPLAKIGRITGLLGG